jgi:hypothetical protein
MQIITRVQRKEKTSDKLETLIAVTTVVLMMGVVLSINGAVMQMSDFPGTAEHR